jgi:hypothetical protein
MFSSHVCQAREALFFESVSQEHPASKPGRLCHDGAACASLTALQQHAARHSGAGAGSAANAGCH